MLYFPDGVGEGGGGGGGGRGGGGGGGGTFPDGVLKGARSTRTLARSFSFRPKKSPFVNELAIFKDQQKGVALPQI